MGNERIGICLTFWQDPFRPDFPEASININGPTWWIGSEAEFLVLFCGTHKQRGHRAEATLKEALESRFDIILYSEEFDSSKDLCVQLARKKTTKGRNSVEITAFRDSREQILWSGNETDFLRKLKAPRNSGPSPHLHLIRLLSILWTEECCKERVNSCQAAPWRSMQTSASH